MARKNSSKVVKSTAAESKVSAALPSEDEKVESITTVADSTITSKREEQLDLDATLIQDSTVVSTALRKEAPRELEETYIAAAGVLDTEAAVETEEEKAPGPSSLVRERTKPMSDDFWTQIGSQPPSTSSSLQLSRQTTKPLSETQTAEERPSLEIETSTRHRSSPPPANSLSRHKVTENLATPKGRGDRPLFTSYSADMAHRKRPQGSSLLSGHSARDSSSHPLARGPVLSSASNSPGKARTEDSSSVGSDSSELRAQRLGMELNLATPAAWKKKTLSMSPPLPYVPVPKAWSTLVLDSSKGGSRAQSPAQTLGSKSPGGEEKRLSVSKTRQPYTSLGEDDASMRLLHEIKRQNEELLQANQRLERENAKLKTIFSAVPSSTASALAASSRPLPGSPIRKGEPLYGSKRFDTGGFGLGHPDSEKIIQAEASTSDDAHTAMVKTLTRQLFSVSTLLQTIREAAQEDKIALSEALDKVRASQSRIAELEAEIQSLRPGSSQ